MNSSDHGPFVLRWHHEGSAPHRMAQTSQTALKSLHQASLYASQTSDITRLLSWRGITMLALLLLLGVFILALGLGLWRHHLGAACLIAFAFLALLWILASYAISIDWHDADGIIDCWPSCTAWQDRIAVVFWYTPVVAGVLLLIALLTAITHARNSGENQVILATSLVTLLTCLTIAALLVGGGWSFVF
jgi:hypothetical protein